MNWSPSNTKLYTDFGLFTCNEEICSDVSDVFGQLTGLGKAGKLLHLWQAPFTLHSRVIQAIRRETALARQGKPAHIIAKMNALLEPQMIRALLPQAACIDQSLARQFVKIIQGGTRNSPFLTLPPPPATRSTWGNCQRGSWLQMAWLM